MNFPLTSEHTGPIGKGRILFVALAFLFFLSYLLTTLFRLQIFSFESYKNKVFEQITTSSSLVGERGRILDRNGNVLATSETSWRLFVSTKDIVLYTERDGVDYAARIADGLSSLLKTSKDFLYKKITTSRVLDVTLAKSIDAETFEKCISFIAQNRLEKLVFTEAQTTRYYPYGTTFAHVLGFTGSDNQGLYGLEYSYDDTLSGKNGYYVYAKDANGNMLPTEYASYVPPQNGNDLVTTLDLYVQQMLESELESIRQNHDVQNRVTGIVMDTETGAILAMATSSPFDPNTPYVLDSESLAALLNSGLAEGSDEYKAKKRELLEIMWSNKAISETYEPGSTFKIVTVSTALECGAASTKDRFSCHGYYAVGGWHIRCHKTTGHGSGFSLAYGLQMSCNPTMMQLAERIGADTFYDSIESFGYFEKTGIDLPSEASTIFHKKENIGSTELATVSFGQRFKVTVLSQLTAVAAVANRGMSVSPHVMESIVDPKGNTVESYEAPESRRIISEAVARCVSDILEEGVSGDGGAKNAYVDGYKVAAKTGTSQKFDVLDENGNSYLRIGSTVAYAPSDEGGIAVILVVDEPTSAVKYGSVVAAPYVSSLFTKVLPYLEYAPNKERTLVEVGSYTGLPIVGAKDALGALGLSYEIVGDGETVLSQIPAANEIVSREQTKVILYTEERESSLVEVPRVTGMDALTANRTLTDLGFCLRIVGAQTLAEGETAIVSAQSVVPGETLPYGSVIEIQIVSLQGEE